jgi:hypothetical protein
MKRIRAPASRSSNSPEYRRVWANVRGRTLEMNHLYDPLQCFKVGGIPSVESQIVCCGRRGNKQIREPGADRLSSGSCSREHSAVHARSFCIEVQRVPRCARPLQSVLASSAFVLIFRSVRTRRQLSKGYCRNCGFIRQQRGINQIVVDHHRRIEEPSRRFSHRYADLSQHRDLHGTVSRRPEVRSMRLRQGFLEARTGAAV